LLLLHAAATMASTAKPAAAPRVRLCDNVLAAISGDPLPRRAKGAGRCPYVAPPR
jgi:hypothetical protein